MPLFGQLLWNRWIWSTGALIYIAILFYHIWRLYYNAWLYSYVNDDAGTYLAIVERIHEGWRPIEDLRVGYTPLGLMVMAFFRKIFFSGNHNYSDYTAVILCFNLASGCMTYAIARAMRVHVLLGMVASLYVLLSIYLHEGYWIFLEPFCVFFALCAIWVYIKFDNPIGHVLAGGFCCLAFLSKQYGLAVLGAIFCATLISSSSENSGRKNSKTTLYWYLSIWMTYLILWMTRFKLAVFLMPVFSFGAIIILKNSDFRLKDSIAQIIRVIFGFLLTLTLFAFLIKLNWNVSPIIFLKSLYPVGYVQSIVVVRPSIMAHLFYSHVFILFFPLFFYIIRTAINKNIIVVFFAFSFFFASLSIRSFGHYFILTIPFSVLCGCYIFKCLKAQKNYLVFFLLVMSILIPWKAYRWEVDYSKKYMYRTSQKDLANWIKPRLKGRPTLPFIYPGYVYLCDILPVAPKTLGYGFISNFSANQVVEFVRQSPVILLDKKDDDYCYREIKKIESLEGPYREFFKSLGFVLEDEMSGRIEIWSRPNVVNSEMRIGRGSSYRDEVPL